MRSLVLLVVVRVHTWSDVCPVCGSMRNTGSLYVLHALRLPKSSLLAALVMHTYNMRVCSRICACLYMFIYVCINICYINVRVRVHVHVMYTSKRTESNSRENAILWVRVCLADRGVLGIVEKLWNLVAYGSRVLSLAED